MLSFRSFLHLPRRCFSSFTASNKITKALVDGNYLRLTYGAESSAERNMAFHFTWLYDNCSSLVTSSNQKLFREVAVLQGVKPIMVKVAEDQQSVIVSWPKVMKSTLETVYEPKVSNYGLNFLLKHSCSLERLKMINSSLNPVTQSRELLRISFRSLFPKYPDLTYSSEIAVLAFLKSVNSQGLCVVTDVPSVNKIVTAVSSLIGEPSHRLYGEYFDVKSEVNPINIAYTNKSLEFHLDLSYYESPPGIQFLHALSFPESISGGESLFIDSHAVATELRDNYSKHFEVLKEVPGTFMKKHLKRDNPVIMYYQRPHIVTNHVNEVISVFWSPPFEGPLFFPHERKDPKSEKIYEKYSVEDYYAAYGKFQELLNSKEMLKKYGFEFRLKEGEMVVFNNRRLLHARNSFQNSGVQSEKSENKVRHLQGCYNDIDAFLNRFRLLTLKHEDPKEERNKDPLSVVGENRAGISHFR